MAKSANPDGIRAATGRTLLLMRGGKNRLLTFFLRPLFHKCGSNVRFQATDHFSYRSITIGNDVYIGPGATFSATHSSLHIGNKVSFGPNVTIMAGNHNTSVLGQTIYDTHEVRPEDNRPIVISDDVWVGAGAIILHGCHIGRGAIVAAGALVRQDVPPYAVVAGMPARIIRFRWTVEEILHHEQLLYPAEERLSLDDLEEAGMEFCDRGPADV